MFQFDVLLDTSVLPPNVMALRDEKFIDFVKVEAGDGVAALLDIQGINCVRSLLVTPNIYSIMDVRSKSLDGFKNKYGYIQEDGSFIIQPGIKGNAEYLIDLLKKKCIEDAKSLKSSKYNQSSSTSANSTSPATSNNSSEKMLSKTSNLSIGEHKKYIIDTLNSWCESNSSRFDVSQLSLNEGRHYFISIYNDSTGSLKCDIKCCCNKWSTLTLRRGKFQLSNFYRHLQSSGDICSEVKKMIDNPQSRSSANTQQSLETSDDVPQQVVAPKLTAVISPPHTNQSNSNLSTASSISISTDNAENIIQQSLSPSKSKSQMKRKVETLESSYKTRESAAKRTRRR
ncbi:unnamed protein product [Rotaria sp. Silwood2]|nr:unnamed protein product [Rotaria sp. Silwood2]CAF4212056.1 unnamed protein product [Rotaria sp. Silwood2]CAF4342776.1 unnamed protein product [Rotaria sp. Silwood2]CAF4524654.1 unnamed protein product [Rotaria sp. Silwood2]